MSGCQVGDEFSKRERVPGAVLFVLFCIRA